jgi:hypothetical protein
MSRVSRAAPHLSLEAVEQKFKSTDSYWHRQKWLIVYNGLVDPRPASAICASQQRFAIAKQTGVSVGTVHKVPVEHIWEDIRENYFYNRILKSMDRVVDTLCQGLVELSSAPERLRSLTYFPHLRISC